MDNAEMEDKKPIEGLPAEEQTATPDEGASARPAEGASGAGKPAASGQDDARQWFVVHCYSG